MYGTADNKKSFHLRMGQVTLYSLPPKDVAVRVHICPETNVLLVLGRDKGAWVENHSMAAQFIADLSEYMKQRAMSGHFYLGGAEYLRVNQRYTRSTPRARAPL